MATNSRTCSAAASQVYSGPVPIVTHLHGAEGVGDESDGYPEAWYLPANCKNLPAGYATVGTWYNIFKKKFLLKNWFLWAPGTAASEYPNEQAPTQMWFHDHTLGVTRLNVYSGLAGLYNLRKKGLHQPELPGIPFPPAGADNKLTTSTQLRELPIVLQDRAFYNDGKLFYPKNAIPGEKLPAGPYNPFWVPEFFPEANGASLACMVVNGKTWPKVAVARSKYRLRLLNGANSRTYVISFSLSPPPATGDTRPTAAERLPFYIIGNEGGFLAQPQRRDQILMGNADRFDLIFDFSKPEFQGHSIYMRNAGPEGPFSSPADANAPDFAIPPEYTAQIMRFDVENTTTVDNRFNDGSTLVTGVHIPVQPAPIKTRRFALLETMGPVVNASGLSYPLAQYLGEFTGTDPATSVPFILKWDDKITTNPTPGTTEDWSFINLTPDAYPIHIHERMFQVVSRTNIVAVQDANGMVTGYTLTTPVMESPEELTCTVSNRLCMEDTFLVYAGTAVTVRVTFPAASRKNPWSASGLFPWHCHVLEHEDNEMMRPFCIGQPGYLNP